MTDEGSTRSLNYRPVPSGCLSEGSYRNDPAKWSGSSVSLHPLAPTIPWNKWNELSKEQQDRMSKEIGDTYEKIAEEQRFLSKVGDDCFLNFHNLPLWKRIPCYLGIHDVMFWKYQSYPDIFMRITYCRRCGNGYHGRTIWFMRWLDRSLTLIREGEPS